MTSMPQVSDRTATQRVADGVREMIRDRKIPRGGVLPNYYELCLQLDVSYVTVKHGLDLLEAEGLIRRFPFKGTFVAKELEPPACALEHIGLIYAASRSHFFKAPWLSEIMQGIADGAPPHGDIHLFSMREQGLIDAAQLGEWAVQGVILLNVENSDYLRTFASWGVPGVVVDYCPQDVPLDYVACDNASAACRAVEHLAGIGHRRVAYVADRSQKPVVNPRDAKGQLMVRDFSDTRERREESVRCLRQRGMFSGHLEPADARWDWAVQAAKLATQWRHQSDRPTAILTDDENAASALMQELRRCGLRIPEDVSVCAVGGTGEFAQKTGERITCCHFDFAGMGRKAVELLASRCLRTAPPTPSAVRVGFTFAEGETTRPCS